MTSMDANTEKKAAPGKGGAPQKSKGETTKVGVATVKNVTSGTSVVISGLATKANAIPPEKVIQLSGIQAPRLQRVRDPEKDEPYAFQSREYLRKMLIGKQVGFTVKHAAGGREYGDLTLGGNSVSEAIISSGYATVKAATNKDGKMHPDREALFGLETQAKTAGRGMHAKGVAPETMVRTMDFQPDTFDFYFKNKGKAVPVVVDYVHNGSLISVEVPSPDLKHKLLNVNLCGILCGRTTISKKGGKGKKGDQKVNPIALYAQYYVTKRLLKRDMHLIAHGIDKHGNLYGRLVFAAHPERDITKMLLKNGLGKYIPWTASLLDPKLAGEYKVIEAQARATGIGRWRTSQDGHSAQDGKFEQVKILMVLSGDTVIALDEKGSERRMGLASVRTPRLGRRDGTEAEPLGFEAKEFLRNKLVGKKCLVKLEYSRGPANNLQHFVSIGQGRQNVNLQLCELGYATTITHRVDEPRAHNYIQLVEAEKKAQKMQKGLHAKNASVHKYTDLTERPKADKKAEGNTGKRQARGEAEAARARALLPQLAGTQLRGHVEYVMSGKGMKVYLTGKKIMCMVVLAGVQVPRAPGKNFKGDKYGKEAADYVKTHCLQQNVIIEIPEGEDAVDRRGNFFAYIWTESSRNNIACGLLENGLAKIFMRSAEKGGHLSSLRKAEHGAKSKRLRVWETFDEEEKKRKEAREERKKAEAKSKYQKIKVTEIVDGITFYAQLVEDKKSKSVSDGLAAVEKSQPDDFEAEFGMIAAAKFEDGWHRVQLNDVDEDEGSCTAFFVDYGNKASVAIADLIPIPQELASITPLAAKFTLACVQGPPEGMGWEDPAYERFGELIYGKVWDAEILHHDKQGYHVTLKSTEKAEEGKETSEKELPIQGILLKEGLCKVPRRPDMSMKFLQKEFRNYQREGVENRAGIWEYGEISDEEEEEAGRRRRK
mmetsp:Transcript_28020/g.68106  ORF Transcript_28020/g.68106 Transcript_28020/m.68106 type:complete len:940 (-) Transcript_28020:196-3015(-)